MVVAGTTLGHALGGCACRFFMGNKFAEKIPMKVVHSIAAGICAVMGLLTLVQAEKLFQ
jgi:putative Ca2+/H+ antiporter (TMEM165/GDT1 family)